MCSGAAGNFRKDRIVCVGNIHTQSLTFVPLCVERERQNKTPRQASKQSHTHKGKARAGRPHHPGSRNQSWQGKDPPPKDSEQTRAIGIARHTTTRTSTSIHPEADRRKDRQTQYAQAGATPPSPMMAQGLHPKDLLAHAELPPPRAATRTRYTHPHLPIQADTHINMCVYIYIHKGVYRTLIF